MVGQTMKHNRPIFVDTQPVPGHLFPDIIFESLDGFLIAAVLMIPLVCPHSCMTAITLHTRVSACFLPAYITESPCKTLQTESCALIQQLFLDRLLLCFLESIPESLESITT